jgi:hypothetical protein
MSFGPRGIIRSIWTTNFDSLTLRAAVLTQVPMTIVLNREYSRVRLSDEGPVYVALYGDYRYSALKNTATELRELNHSLRELLVSYLKEQQLVTAVRRAAIRQFPQV